MVIGHSSGYDLFYPVEQAANVAKVIPAFDIVMGDERNGMYSKR